MLQGTQKEQHVVMEPVLINVTSQKYSVPRGWNILTVLHSSQLYVAEEVSIFYAVRNFNALQLLQPLKIVAELGTSADKSSCWTIFS